MSGRHYRLFHLPMTVARRNRKSTRNGHSTSQLSTPSRSRRFVSTAYPCALELAGLCERIEKFVSNCGAAANSASTRVLQEGADTQQESRRVWRSVSFRRIRPTKHHHSHKQDPCSSDGWLGFHRRIHCNAGLLAALRSWLMHAPSIKVVR